MPTRAELESIKWPETMWPVKPDFLRNIPEPFLPDRDLLNRLQYPWELLVLLRETFNERLNHSRIDGSVEIAKNADITGSVWIEEGVKVSPFAVIVGPVYLGKGTFVGNFTQIRGSLIGDNCLVGERVSVIRSIIGQRCSFHLNYVGDSLVAEEVEMGGHASTANRRLDGLSIKSSVSGVRIDTQMEKLGAIIGKETHIGGSCETMPGVKIGARCVVYPKATLLNDLSDNKRCKVVQQLQIE